MKKNLLVLVSLSVLFTALSCNKSVEGTVPGDGDLVTISVALPEEGRVSFSQGEGNALKLSWEATDAIRIISGSQSEVFNIDPASINGGVASFTGNAVEGDSFDILYPADFLNETEADEASYEGQVQNGNDNIGHLHYMALLSGVNTYHDIVFSDAWAWENGGGLCKLNTVMKFEITLPDGVGELKALEVALNDIGRKFSLGLDNVDVSVSDQVLTAYIMIPWEDMSTNASTTVRVITPDYTVYSRTIGLTGTISMGKVNGIKITKDMAKSAFYDGAGTEENPYVIANAAQMKSMMDLYYNAADDAAMEYHFEILEEVDAIDLSGFAWVALNRASPYLKQVYFNGNGKTITGLHAGSVTAYPSFAGVLYGEVRNVTFENVTFNAGNNHTGVVASYIGTGSGDVKGTCSDVTVTNATLTGDRYAGAFAGRVSNLSAPISNCYVYNASVTSSTDRVGGFAGQTDQGTAIENCAVEFVTVKGNINIGGFVGVCYGTLTGCSSSGSVSSSNATSNVDIGVGGLAGFQQYGAIYGCSSSVNINQTTNGRDIGGLIGKMVNGSVENSYSTGDVKGIQRNVGGFIGLVTPGEGKVIVKNCYCTGDVSANSYNGGFIGLHEKGVTEISNCYAAGNVTATGGFAAGGMVGVISTADFSMSNCAAWSGSVTPASYGAGNWSSGAVCGVAFPTCTLADNYRNPAMNLTAYWVPDADYSQPNVSPSHPLTDSAGEEMSDASTKNNVANPHYPQYPYHGKVDAGRTLSQLASTTLGWSAEIWDFSAELPTLK
ncbi:MAG: hypothetical protein J5764_02330 [Bacteroidales bacterium]|nr:hypothetical protein [Bacteroidales bacterium]